MTDTPRKRGRPPKVAPRRTAEIHLYLTPDELAAIDAARGAEDRTVWIRQVLLQAASVKRDPPV
jgi:hypothetical protein